ncbi:substrate-binding periplasmic protein [Magnetospirillum aberrantis]|uniref:Amino acid ABC transporter substrate-binding protein n=1 Tax=Magnetospirillum aberrantis SpK TaxID=908842 RepID=A0A7C9V071_9PROT|nr:transporter substrate-binding domain-containing protein [Magnetospirillum aberrantis]NFV80934.1 amino acid ABC transporter substrate-binding protein [Magnetospirillum aberrantis SpK]
MSRGFAAAILAVLGMFATTAVGQGAARADEIVLGADEWCPYNCAAESDRPGYAVEIAREIFAKAGHRVEYRTMPWSRALQECRRGRLTGVIGADHTETPDFVFPALAVAVTDTTFVVRKDNPWRYTGPDSLSQLLLGGILGYSYDGAVGNYVHTNARDGARVDLVGGDTALEMNLRKLVAGRIGATMDAKPVLAYKIKEMGLAGEVAYAGSVDPTENFIAFSPALSKARDYAAIWDKGLAEMRESGRLAQILDRYGVSDWR